MLPFRTKCDNVNMSPSHFLKGKTKSVIIGSFCSPSCDPNYLLAFSVCFHRKSLIDHRPRDT